MEKSFTEPGRGERQSWDYQEIALTFFGKLIKNNC